MDLHDLGTAKQSSESYRGGIRGERDHHRVDNREETQERTATLRHDLPSALLPMFLSGKLTIRRKLSPHALVSPSTQHNSEQAKKEEPMEGLGVAPIGGRTRHPTVSCHACAFSSFPGSEMTAAYLSPMYRLARDF